MEEEKEVMLYLMAKFGLSRTPTPFKAGVYVPPSRLRSFASTLKGEEISKEVAQRLRWELLRQSLTSIVNRANVGNVSHIVVELFNENLLWSKGLLVKALMKSQLCSPMLTPVYAAILASINSMLPEVGELLCKRVLLAFRRAVERNDRVNCQSTCRFLAHLINQQVLEAFFGLHLIVFLLENLTEDSVELACFFLKECGLALQQASSTGLGFVFERLKSILHEGELTRKTRFVIEEVFEVRRQNFADFPGVIEPLDLVLPENKITHSLQFADEGLDAEEGLNRFEPTENLEALEAEWATIRAEILGEETVSRLQNPGQIGPISDEIEPAAMPPDENEVARLRESIYHRIMNSVKFEEAAHKLLALRLPPNQMTELARMIVDCCAEEKSYSSFYGNLARKLCEAEPRLPPLFFKEFVERYADSIDSDTQKSRRVASLFANLFASDSIDWLALSCVKLSESETTAASRIFLKVLFQEIAKSLGVENLRDRLFEEANSDAVAGIFGQEAEEDLIFAANFFAAIGLKEVARPLRDLLEEAQANPASPHPHS